jgi:hypothetical protein
VARPQKGSEQWYSKKSGSMSCRLAQRRPSGGCSAVLDPSRPVRSGVSLFNAVRLHFHLKGVTQEQGTQLIETFKRR